MIRIITRIVIVSLATSALFFFTGNFLLAKLSEAAVEKITGFPTNMGSLQFHLPDSLHIQNLTLENPSGFQKKVFVKIPEIYIALDIPALLKKEALHLKEVRLDIQEVHIEKNVSGVSNIGLLSSLADSQKKEEASSPSKLPFQLDLLTLTLRQVSYSNASGIIPQAASIDLHVEQKTFKQIRSPFVLVQLIIYQILKGASFGNLGINTESLEKNVEEVLHLGTEALQLGVHSLKETHETVSGLVGGLKNTVLSLSGKSQNRSDIH